MLKILAVLILLFSNSFLLADLLPEFDGIYIKTQKNTTIELKEKESLPLKIENKDLKQLVAPNAKIDSKGFYSVQYLNNKKGLIKINPLDFKGLFLKGTYDPNSFTLRKLISITSEKKESFHFPLATKIDVRKKSIDNTTYYFKPRKDLENGQFVVNIDKKNWLFEISDEYEKKLSDPVLDPKKIMLNDIYNFVENMPEDSYLGFHTKGESLEGLLIDKVIYLPMGAKKSNGKERLKLEAGLELEKLKDKIIISDLVFGKPAYNKKMDFDYQIINLYKIRP